MYKVYKIGEKPLSYADIDAILSENMQLALSPQAIERIEHCRRYLDDKVAESKVPLYGITTGFGSLCDRNISADDLSTLQENLVKSHACSVGDELAPVIIKLMMLLKANALSL